MAQGVSEIEFRGATGLEALLGQLSPSRSVAHQFS
jgi:23S rRNA maturation mini-RNase III